MEDLTYLELYELYQESIVFIHRIDSKVRQYLNNGDKSRAKIIECDLDHYWCTIFEIENILNIRTGVC